MLWADVAAAKASGGQWQQWLALPRPAGSGVYAAGTHTLASQLRMEPDALELLCVRALGTRLKTGVWEGLGAVGDVARAKARSEQWQHWLTLPRPVGNGVYAAGTHTLASQLRMEPGALELLCAKALGARITEGAWVKAGVVGVVRQQNNHKYILPCATDSDNYPQPIMAHSQPQPPWVLSPSERPAPFSVRADVLLQAARQQQAAVGEAGEAAADAAAAEKAGRKSRFRIQNTMKECVTSGGRKFSVPSN